MAEIMCSFDVFVRCLSVCLSVCVCRVRSGTVKWALNATGHASRVLFLRIEMYSPTFLPARRYASAGLCDSDVSVRPSVRLSVCHTPVLCLAERKQDREMYTI